MTGLDWWAAASGFLFGALTGLVTFTVTGRRVASVMTAGGFAAMVTFVVLRSGAV